MNVTATAVDASIRRKRAPFHQGSGGHLSHHSKQPDKTFVCVSLCLPLSLMCCVASAGGSPALSLCCIPPLFSCWMVSQGRISCEQSHQYCCMWSVCVFRPLGACNSHSTGRKAQQSWEKMVVALISLYLSSLSLSLFLCARRQGQGGGYYPKHAVTARPPALPPPKIYL